MRIDLRDGIKDELDTTIPMTVRWIIRLVFFSLILGAILFGWITRKNTTETISIENQIMSLFEVTRGVSDTSYGTYWNFCGGWFTADHVHEAMNYEPPDFVSDGVLRAPGLIDAAWYGRKWSCPSPANPKDGMPVYLLGYPGGSDKPTLRQGKVHIRRAHSGSEGYRISTWIVVFDPREEAGISGEAVVGGMSGSIVTDHNYNPVGILVTQNSPSDFNGDGDLENSVDIVGLADVYEVLFKT